MKLASTRALTLITLITFGLTLACWLWPIDLWLTAQLYYPGAPEPWPIGELWLFAALYQLVPVATVASGIITGLALCYPHRLCWRWRRALLLLVLALILTPGLIVNALLKEHWGHHRPVHVEAFGGQQDYQPPLWPARTTTGRSFPSGHVAAISCLLVVLFIWPRQATGWLVVPALIVLVALGRMAAGGHFFSDTLWGAYLSYLTLWLLFHRSRNRSWRPLLRHPTSRRWRQLSGLIAVVLICGCSWQLLAGSLQ